MLACGKRGRAFVVYRSSCAKTTLEASRTQGLDQSPRPRSRSLGGLARKSPLPREARTALGPAWFALERLCRGLVSGVEAADVVHPRFVTLLWRSGMGWHTFDVVGRRERTSSVQTELSVVTVPAPTGNTARFLRGAKITLFYVAFFYLAGHARRTARNFRARR